MVYWQWTALILTWLIWGVALYWEHCRANTANRLLDHARFCLEQRERSYRYAMDLYGGHARIHDERLEMIQAAVRNLVHTGMYQNGLVSQGVSVEFLMRITLLEYAANLRERDDALVREASEYLYVIV